MDQRQKDLLSSIRDELAEKIEFMKIAKCLLQVELLSEEQIEEIMEAVENPWVRNLKLIDALLESQSPKAFDEFERILDTTKNLEALKLVSPNNSTGKSRCQAERKGYFTKMFKFGQSQKYPLGMNSGLSAGSPAVENTYSSPSQRDKEQINLVSSDSHRSFVSKDSGFSQCKTQTASIDPTLPSSSSSVVDNSGYQLPPSRQLFNTQGSQTPTRPRELRFEHLSVSDTEDDNILSTTSEVVWHPYAQPQTVSTPGNQPGGNSQRATSPHYHYCLPTSYASSESDSSSDSIRTNPSAILNPDVTTAIARQELNMMQVKMATVCHNNPSEDYKMTAEPRGPCVIVNNVDFEGDIFPTRKGSDQDAKRFDQIFKEMGFSVIPKRNLTADQMRQLFKEVAASCKPEHDSLFVFILSHGSEVGIYGTDGIEVNLENEIISCFDNRNCRAMLGKPKVFVIQACRGRSKDCGGDGDVTDSIAWPSVAASPSVRSASQENRVPDHWSGLRSSQPDGKKRKHPIRTDMLLVFSCLAGFVSVRNETAGSWLGVALAYFIMTHAHERDLLRILNLVTSDVISRESSHGHIQSIELKLLGWTKNLYFNPALTASSKMDMGPGPPASIVA